MGSWGTGLYQNDIASDVKLVFGDLSRRPTDTDTLVSQVLEKFGISLSVNDDDSADVILSLADILHQYALDHPATMAAARLLIEDGRDLAIKKSLGMSTRDLEKREKVLAEALDRWSLPHPKPRKRKAPKEPEPFLLEVGDVWAFPTMRHAARPFQIKDVDLSQFQPDGWGVFAIADQWHHEGHRACYLFVLAIVPDVATPTLKDALAARVQQYTFHMSAFDEDKTGVMIFEGRLWKCLMGIKQWPAVKLGSAVFDADRVRQLQDQSSYNAKDSDGIRWLEDELLKTSFHMAASNARTGLSYEINPHPTLRLSDLTTAA